MKQYSYNNFSAPRESITAVPLKAWNELAKRVELQFLHAKKLHNHASSIDSEIDKLTTDWVATERERFRHWFKQTKTLKAQSESTMERTAEYGSLYSPHGSAETQEKFDNARKSLVRRLRKLQNEISELYQHSAKNIQWGDAPGTHSQFSTGDEKIGGILNALNTVCTLLSTLRTKELTAAVLMRTAGFISGISPQIGDRYKEVVGSRSELIRIARSAEVSTVANEIKKEMDAFNYGTHLRRMYSIYDKLSRLGLNSSMNDMEAIIQKSLGDITGLYKKLSEVYVTLMELPEQVNEPDASIGKTVTPPDMKDKFRTIPEKPQNMPAADPAQHATPRQHGEGIV